MRFRDGGTVEVSKQRQGQVPRWNHPKKGLIELQVVGMADEDPGCHAPEQLTPGIGLVMRRVQARQCVRQVLPSDVGSLLTRGASECPPRYDAPPGRLAFSAIETLDEKSLPIADLAR